MYLDDKKEFLDFRQWLENYKIGGGIELLPLKVLFQYGMSGVEVPERREVVQLQEQVQGFQMDPGELAVLVDEGNDWLIIAIPSSFFGFLPYKTPKKYWKKTGRWFKGTNDEFKALNKGEAGYLNLGDLKPLIEEAQRRYPKLITKVDWKERELVMIFFHKPKMGGLSYWNPFQITVRAERPQLYTIRVYAKIAPDPHVNVRTMNVKREEVASALVGAIQFLKTLRKEKK
jgi:hypothetical protein